MFVHKYSIAVFAVAFFVSSGRAMESESSETLAEQCLDLQAKIDNGKDKIKKLKPHFCMSCGFVGKNVAMLTKHMRSKHPRLTVISTSYQNKLQSTDYLAANLYLHCFLLIFIHQMIFVIFCSRSEET